VSLSIGNRLLSLVGDHSAMNALADDLITVAAGRVSRFGAHRERFIAGMLE
jgi:hypothetical protein